MLMQSQLQCSKPSSTTSLWLTRLLTMFFLLSCGTATVRHQWADKCSRENVSFWFRKESSRNAKSNERFTDLLKAASVIAFLVTLLHVVALMTRADGEWPLIVAVLCIVLPPTGVVLVSISNAYAHRSRSQAYRQQARLLSRWEPEVQSALDQAIAANTRKKDEELRSAYLHTSIIVGIVEEALLVELYQFVLMMERLEFEAAP